MSYVGFYLRTKKASKTKFAECQFTVHGRAVKALILLTC